MKKSKQKVKGILCLPITESSEKKIGDVGKLEATIIKNGLVLMKSKMTAVEVVETLEGLGNVLEELYLILAEAAGICKDCNCREETEDAVSIKLPDFILKEAGISKDAKLCACTIDGCGEVTVMEAEYKHDLSDVPQNILEILKEMGICMSGINECLMTEKIIYGE